MMTFLSYLFAFLLIVDCLLLGLLVLVQLPKKEAGVGMAFGGGAADALFGAGSGTALTKLTKYCAIVFFHPRDRPVHDREFVQVAYQSGFRTGLGTAATRIPADGPGR